MALILPYRNYLPKIDSTVFLASNATLIGEVEVGKQSNIWYQAVLRGDVGAIHIGQQTSVQDGVIIHCTTHKSTTWVGDRVIVGHRAILHGCRIEDEVLIGMGAIVLDNAIVPSHTLIAAGALIPEGRQLESGFVYAGVPAKRLKPLSEVQIDEIREGALRYVQKGEEYQRRLQ